ncbi:MAG: peptide ABC transporter substrate-binding protein [Lachnospiraceae bacterium]|nr:peptide ABC transporter substrate-binding protein [Lachnospiraceae bacterium]
MKKRSVAGKLMAVMLTAAMTVSMTACGDSPAETLQSESSITQDTAEESTESSVSEDTQEDTSAEEDTEEQEFDFAAYEELSTEIYQEQMGEFYDIYMAAKETDTVSERYALMAVAEAKLMESAVMLPTTTVGGRYAISRVAPYTVDYVLWGSDYNRYHQALICTEPILAEHRAEMKEKWTELKGTGTYEDWAKEYLQEKGYTLKDSYLFVYTDDPTTWDVLSSSLAVDCEPLVNTYDGLLEYDTEGILQPALAEEYSVSEDGLVYTFKLREGVAWVDSQGRKVADVVADDFVAGMQHMMDAEGGLEYLVEGVIANASQYINGEITDFSQVGVRAVDTYTLEYTLEAPCSYFTTMLGYSIFAPMSRSYYQSMGGKFGEEYDPTAPDYEYGLDFNSIAYCGPYLVTNATEKNTILFKANESYWNKDNINLQSITWLYNDGSDVTRSYNDMKAGIVDGVNLNSSTLTMAMEDGWFDQYAYISNTDATSYMVYYNLNRSAFANSNDASALVSAQTQEDAARTNAALSNVHFRRAISFALDRGSYNAQSVGEELKNNSLRNSYTPWNFVSLEEDVTIEINGTPTTFEAGTFYGIIMQAQIDADGVPIKVYDPEADGGSGSGDGYDGWYNVENAVAELEIAIEELAAEGVVIDETNPIQLDLPYPSNSEVYVNKVNVYKQSLEEALGGKVIVNLISSPDYDGWYDAGYYTTYGYEQNYDLYDLSGWIPDYGDPCSYLDTMLPDYAGYMTRCFGIF